MKATIKPAVRHCRWMATLGAGMAVITMTSASPALGSSQASLDTRVRAQSVGASVPGAASIAISPDGNRLYVSYLPAGPAAATRRGISVVDPASMTVLNAMTYAPGGTSDGSPTAIVSSDGSLLYALDNAGATVIDTATMTPVGRRELSRYQWEGLSLSTATSMLPNGIGPFALSSGPAQPSRCADVDGCPSPPLEVDLKRPTDTSGDLASLGVNGLGKRLVMAPNGSRAYVLVQIGSADGRTPSTFGVFDLPDAATQELAPRWATASGSPIDVAISPDGTRAYLASRGSSSAAPGWVSVIDIPTMTEIGTIPLATPPAAIAVAGDGLHAYVASSDRAGTVSALDLTSPRLAPSAPLSVTVKPGHASATVSWSKPAAAGASAITGYRVTVTPGTSRSCRTAALSCTFTKLTPGKRYSVTVVAMSPAGSGASSTSTVKLNRQ